MGCLRIARALGSQAGMQQGRMTMRKGTLMVAVAAALLGLGATSAKADTPVLGPSTNTVELRVVNNHASRVMVYVQDSRGKLHSLGRVASADFEILQIPGEIAAMGDVQIKIFPSEPVWSLLGDDAGVATRGIALRLGDAVNMFVETNLYESQVEIQRG